MCRARRSRATTRRTRTSPTRDTGAWPRATLRPRRIRRQRRRRRRGTPLLPEHACRPTVSRLADNASPVLRRSPPRIGNLCRMEEREEHERGLARFLVGEWRARFRESLAPAKRRDVLRSQLPHLAHLDPRFSIPMQAQSALELGAQLREKGAGDRCYLLSED